MTEVWIVNASPVITMAKAGYLQLFHQLAVNIVIPEAVAREIQQAPSSDPARKALESGWGERASPNEIPPTIVEWGLGTGETAVLALAAERPGCTVVIDDFAARRCARTLGLTLIGTLGTILRARKKRLIPSAGQAIMSLRAVGLRLNDQVIREALDRVVGEKWPIG